MWGMFGDEVQGDGYIKETSVSVYLASTQPTDQNQSQILLSLPSSLTSHFSLSTPFVTSVSAKPQKGAAKTDLTGNPPLTQEARSSQLRLLPLNQLRPTPYRPLQIPTPHPQETLFVEVIIPFCSIPLEPLSLVLFSLFF